MRPDDVEALAALHSRCFGEEAWTAEAFEALLAGPGCYGWLMEPPDGTTAARPVALLLARQAADEAEVLTICVDPRRRREGLAKRLASHLIADVKKKGAVSLYLEVSARNTAARALYQDLGFLAIGERRNYYPGSCAGERVNAHMLRLSLGA